MAARAFVDLFSDTGTRPSLAMRRAMAEAEVGDEQKGEDPTTRRLEERVADLLGKPAAMFVPSGTMCNQIALGVHCRVGDEIIAPDNAHITTYEAGGGAAFAGVQNRSVPATRGKFSGADVTTMIRNPATRHHPRSRLVAIEQTTNLGGGAVWTLAEIEDVARVTRAHGLVLHMDGARLMNAVAASNVSAAAMCAPCDTTWLDLSKGLGCPVGAVLAGPVDFINEAWRWKHRLGGAMRQSGILAAAGLYALDHNQARLAQDHANAKRFAALAAEIPGVRVTNPEVETNIVFLDISATGRTAADLSARALAHGARIGATAPTLMRALTHLDVSAADMETAAAALRRAVTEA
jgi:threonine aldolase